MSIALSALNHLPVCMRIFQVHVERGRIGCDDPLKSSLAAPEFHAALEVRVENPHVILSPKALDGASFLPEAILLTGREDKGEARGEGECNEGQLRNRTRQATVVLIKRQDHESNLVQHTCAQVAQLESQSEDRRASIRVRVWAYFY